MSYQHQQQKAFFPKKVTQLRQHFSIDKKLAKNIKIDDKKFLEHKKQKKNS